MPKMNRPPVAHFRPTLPRGIVAIVGVLVLVAAGCEGTVSPSPEPLPPREPDVAEPDDGGVEQDGGVTPEPTPTPEPSALPEPAPSPTPEPTPDDGGVLQDAGPLDGGAPQSDGGPIAGDLDVDWIAGAQNCNNSDQEPLQVHQYSARTWIIRQSKCTNFEGPFIYLLVGDDRALLLDTGATQNANDVPVQETVESLLQSHLDTWPGAPDRDAFELIVAHTHGHGDHRAGDGQFNGEANTEVIGTSQNAVRTFFGLDDWPDGVVEYDLGGRVLDILPIPGHQQAHIALYDRHDGLLLTGDSVYPGNLFIQNFGEYRTSIDDLTVFAAERPVVWVLGTHVEMTANAGVDYPYGTTYQPDEHVLQLTFAHLVELRDALAAMGNNGQREVHDDFIISP